MAELIALATSLDLSLAFGATNSVHPLATGSVQESPCMLRNKSGASTLANATLSLRDTSISTDLVMNTTQPADLSWVASRLATERFRSFS